LWLSQSSKWIQNLPFFKELSPIENGSARSNMVGAYIAMKWDWAALNQTEKAIKSLAQWMFGLQYWKIHSSLTCGNKPCINGTIVTS
jgi:hypothetical protein